MPLPSALRSAASRCVELLLLARALRHLQAKVRAVQARSARLPSPVPELAPDVLDHVLGGRGREASTGGLPSACNAAPISRNAGRKSCPQLRDAVRLVDHEQRDARCCSVARKPASARRSGVASTTRCAVGDARHRGAGRAGAGRCSAARPRCRRRRSARPGPSSARSAATPRRCVPSGAAPAADSTATCRRPWASSPACPAPPARARSRGPGPGAGGAGRRRRAANAGPRAAVSEPSCGSGQGLYPSAAEGFAHFNCVQYNAP